MIYISNKYLGIPRRALWIVAMFGISLPLTSCFTGIESTKKITLSREERAMTMPTPEETFLLDILPVPHTEWEEGKRFIVADSRVAILVEPRYPGSGDSHQLKEGDTLVFRQAAMRRIPDGSSRLQLSFMHEGEEYLYSEGKKGGSAQDTVMSDDIPGLIDPALTRRIGERLEGKQLWTLSTFWQTRDGRRKAGRKYIPVVVDNVISGNMVYPVVVEFHDAAGEKGYYQMMYSHTGKEARGFQSLFSLSDPRLKHPEISDDAWRMITRGEVAEGMTKEECRLAKGNPSETDGGRNYSSTLLIWRYPDGTVLYFIDDILRGVNAIPAD